MAKRVYTEKDIQEWIASGKSVSDLPERTILTPAARDLVKGQGGAVRTTSAPAASKAAPAEPILPEYTYRWESRKDPATPTEIQTFFKSPEIEILKQRMCDIGRRMWEKGYVDGNGGNLLIRVGEIFS